MYSYAPYYSFLRVLGCTCFVFYPFVECSKSSFHSIICVFLRYGEGKKKNVALIQLAINYMFLVMFSSLSIYLSFIFLSCFIMSLIILNLFTLILYWMILIVFLQILALWFLIITLLFLLLWLLQLLLRLWIIFPHILLSILVSFTQLPNFIYSSYLDSFTSFLAFIHNFFWSLSYKEVILDPLWQ